MLLYHVDNMLKVNGKIIQGIRFKIGTHLTTVLYSNKFIRFLFDCMPIFSRVCNFDLMQKKYVIINLPN